jgi:hypothetical protein
MYEIDIEVNEVDYIVVYEFTKGEPRTYDYPGSPGDVIIHEVYGEDGSKDIVKDLSWEVINEFVEKIYEYQENNF